MSPPLNPPPEVLREAAAHLASCYPEEGCGLLLRRDESWRFLPMKNVATRFHLADPETFPRDARTAYLFDPGEQRRAFAWAREEGWSVVAIVHSHCDEPPNFSEMDREMAMAEGDTPLHPGVEYLVVSVVEGQARKARMHAWRSGGWSERNIPL